MSPSKGVTEAEVAPMVIRRELREQRPRTKLSGELQFSSPENKWGKAGEDRSGFEANPLTCFLANYFTSLSFRLCAPVCGKVKGFCCLFVFFVFLLFHPQSQCWMGPSKEEGKAKLCVDNCTVLMFCCESDHVGKQRVSPIDVPQWGCSSLDLVKVLQALPRTNRTETQNTEDPTMPTPEAIKLLGKYKGGKGRGFWVKETRVRPEKEGLLRCLSQWAEKFSMRKEIFYTIFFLFFCVFFL